MNESKRPDYDELCKHVQKLNDKIFKLEKENEALRYSLAHMYVQLEGLQSRESVWQEDYYKEHKRAEKLFEELDQLTKGMENKNDKVIEILKEVFNNDK